MAFPNFPGIPPLKGYSAASSAISTISNVAALAQISFANAPPPVWGVFDSAGNPVALADSFLGIDFYNQSTITNAPLEDGAFMSYNKVQMPFTARVMLSKGGSADERTAFQLAVASAAASLNLYTIVTPDANYPNCNIEAYDYTQQYQNGVSIVNVGIRFKQIRIVKAQYTNNTTEPSGASPDANGKVQPVTPTPKQTSVLQDAANTIKGLF